MGGGRVVMAIDLCPVGFELGFTESPVMEAGDRERPTEVGSGRDQRSEREEDEEEIEIGDGAHGGRRWKEIVLKLW